MTALLHIRLRIKEGGNARHRIYGMLALAVPAGSAGRGFGR